MYLFSIHCLEINLVWTKWFLEAGHGLMVGKWLVILNFIDRTLLVKKNNTSFYGKY